MSAGDGRAAERLCWAWHRFEQLGVDHLYDALALRCQVFILEQGPYLDPDGLDRHAWHLLGRAPAGPDSPLLAYLRVVDPGRKFAEPSIGRVITAPAVRGTGLGRELMAAGLRLCGQIWPGQGVRISAQAHLARFYGDFGFGRVGEVYLEDGIDHCEMLRPAAPAVRRNLGA